MTDYILQKGEEYGQIWGPEFASVGANGQPTFVDLNQDGQVVASPSEALSEAADFQVLGNARPDLELGWFNHLRYRSWSVNAFFRGAVGHSLVNSFRAFYEPRIIAQAAYNYVDTDLAIEELTSAQFSSLYVERANFLKLDNLTLAKEFTFKDGRKGLTVSLTGQNLWVWTNYTGLDPEPALVDYGAASNGETVDYSFPSNESLGIDRRYSYWPSRTVVLGVRLQL